MIDDSNDETNFPDKLILTDIQVWRLDKAFANDSSANINYSKTRLSKMIQLGGFYGPLDSTMRPSLGLPLKVTKSLGSA